MKVCVTGANGQLGTDICAVYEKRGHEVMPLLHAHIEVADVDSCRRALVDRRPDLLINTAAMHNVPACESDCEGAFRVNGIGARNLAILADDMDFALVHISTDYVFDGEKGSPYVETDCPGPLNVYGNTKLAGEGFVRAIARRCFVTRVSGLFGKSPCRAKGGRNFVQSMLKLAAERDEVRVVDDEVLSPTYTLNAAEQLEEITRTDAYGLYHMVSEDHCSWHDFAAAIFEMCKCRAKLAVAGPGEFPTTVARPRFSALDNAALRAQGLTSMQPWREGLRRYLADIGALSS